VCLRFRALSRDEALWQRFGFSADGVEMSTFVEGVFSFAFQAGVPARRLFVWLPMAVVVFDLLPISNSCCTPIRGSVFQSSVSSGGRGKRPPCTITPYGV
ncbi:hypothetical protein, partial [Paraburkholderia sp.]|uniref:hypothetical protein n=1 Tax=Paraburkholderia sp. TaxID=1926495 RepID=UPI002AFDF987